MHEPEFINHSFEYGENTGVMKPGHCFTIEPIL